MVKPVPPTAAAIIRSIEKDEQYADQFRNQINQFLRNAIGPRFWVRWRPEFESLAMFTYYAATTLNGLQTLGEEYVRIVQTEKSQLKMPSLIRRLIMVIIKIAAPILIHKALKRLEQIVADQNRELWPPMLNEPENRERLLALMPTIAETVQLLHRIHLITFYFNGTHYELSKRLTGIHYTPIRTWMATDSAVRTYRLLGSLSLAQFLITLVSRYANYRVSCDRAELSSINDDPTGSTSRRLRCALCLERRRSPTATPCGHLFCWQCIHEWLQNKQECPICREKFGPNRLVALVNYE